ncbi:MAG: hypothetical protein WAT92_02600, partial [Saprospiraceae bacterium]
KLNRLKPIRPSYTFSLHLPSSAFEQFSKLYELSTFYFMNSVAVLQFSSSAIEPAAEAGSVCIHDL